MQKLDYVCPKHRDNGIIHITFSKLINGQGCRYCGIEKCGKTRRKEFNYDEAIELCAKNNFEFVDMFRENSIIYIHFICNNHREMGVQKMRKGNMKRDIKGCKYCKGDLPEWKVKEEIKEKFPFYDLVGQYKNMSSDIECHCNRHNHNWFTKPQSLLKGCGCYYCGLEKLAKHQLHSQEEFEKIVFKSNPNIEVISHYNGMIKDISVRCKKCGYEWTQNAQSLVANGTRCKKCSYTYKGEDDVISVLKSLNIDFISQYKFKDCKDKRPLPFDFYLPHYNLCIEFDGLQHFEPRFGIESYNTTVKHDNIKNRYCEDNNIGLLHIPYWDRQNIKQLIINKINNQQNN